MNNNISPPPSIGDPSQPNYTPQKTNSHMRIFFLVGGMVVIIIFISYLLLSKAPEITTTYTSGSLSNSKTSSNGITTTYRNEEYGFEFDYPNNFIFRVELQGNFENTLPHEVSLTNEKGHMTVTADHRSFSYWELRGFEDSISIGDTFYPVTYTNEGTNFYIAGPDLSSSYIIYTDYTVETEALDVIRSFRFFY